MVVDAESAEIAVAQMHIAAVVAMSPFHAWWWELADSLMARRATSALHMTLCSGEGLKASAASAAAMVFFLSRVMGSCRARARKGAVSSKVGSVSVSLSSSMGRQEGHILDVGALEVVHFPFGVLAMVYGAGARVDVSALGVVAGFARRGWSQWLVRVLGVGYKSSGGW